MATFTYSGYRGATPVHGVTDALTIEAARESLDSQGILVLSLRDKAEGGALSRQINLRKTLKLSDSAWVARQVAIMVGSGMKITNTLDLLARQKRKTMVGNVLADIHNRIMQGESAADAFGAHRKELGRLFTAMVAAGERSGTVPETMNRLATLLETRERLRHKVRSALTYPIAVLLLALTLGTIMLIFVVPRFAAIFSSLGSKLPLMTRVVVGLSHLLASNVWIIPVGIVALVVGWRRARANPKTRRKMDRLSMKLPIVGTLIEKAATARVASTLATMLGTGIPLLEALDYAAQSAGNLVFADALEDCAERVKAGSSFSAALVAHPEIPEVMAQLVAVGEESGSVTVVLDKFRERTEVEVEATVESLASLLEPALVTVVGSMVGSMVVAMYLPLFQIINVIGSQKP